MFEEKVKVAIFDNDGTIRKIGKYPISARGDKIQIVSGGENHWMPAFDRNSALYFPRFKRFILFGKRNYEALYIVRRKGAKCVNFQTGEVFGPDPEQTKEAIANTLLREVGKGKIEIPIYVYLILIINTLFGFITLSALGVF